MSSHYTTTGIKSEPTVHGLLILDSYLLRCPHRSTINRLVFRSAYLGIASDHFHMDEMNNDQTTPAPEPTIEPVATPEEETPAEEVTEAPVEAPAPETAA
jgi:hypothetical protein